MQDSVKQDRERYIGGSDIPVIMELSPYKTRYELLLEKAGLKDNDFAGNVYTEYGNALEPKIRDYINKSFKEPFKYKEGKHIREAEGNEIIGVRIHTDGESPSSILEIKTCSSANISEDVNDYKIYLVQLLYYMVITDRKLGLLAVYERPDDLSEEFIPERLHKYTIDIENYTELVEEISAHVERFIEDLEKIKNNPFISEEELLPAEIPDIASRILAFEEQLSYMKRLEEKIKSEKARLKAAMEAASVKSWTTPNGYKITLVQDGEDKEVKEEVLDVERLKSEAPEIYFKFTETKTTIKKGRTGYLKITEPKKKEGG